ncbi:MAG: acyl--CoA ligase [Sphingopyxis sp.]|nr:acyl--CoA ligase [Sphingopyxis sp.]
MILGSTSNSGQRWPAISFAEAEQRLCAPGAPFEFETIDIDGVPTRSWKHQPASLASLARDVRTRFGARDFLIFEDERVSYEGWFRATAALAQGLRARGVAKGDRVALAMRNLPEWQVAFVAATCIGAIVVPLNAWWTGSELNYGLADSGAKVLICDDERWQRIVPFYDTLGDLRHVITSRSQGLPENAERLEAFIGMPGDYGGLPDVDLPDTDLGPDDDATIFYTSGTTGSPKGALGSHRNILACTQAAPYLAHRGALRRGDGPPQPVLRKNLVVIPFFHVTACCSILMPTMHAGNAIVMMRKWDPMQAMGLIERERITNTGGVPTIAWQLIEHPERHRFDLSSLDLIAYGGAPAAAELVRRIASDLKASPSIGWGMTETCATVINLAAEDYLLRPDSCGLALPVSRIKIMNEDGTAEMATGEVGELWASGPQIVKGYWRNPEATAETFRNGWVRTGDLARLDDEGFCYIVDRAKDIIIRGGENIYSSEIENILYEHPAVIDAAVIGIAHRTLGEEPVAVVCLAPESSVGEDDLRGWIGERLAQFKVPVRIHFLTEMLPRNANGKILKKDLKLRFAAG